MKWQFFFCNSSIVANIESPSTCEVQMKRQWKMVRCQYQDRLCFQREGLSTARISFYGSNATTIRTNHKKNGIARIQDRKLLLLYEVHCHRLENTIMGIITVGIK